MRTIENYDDFVASIRDKSNEDRAERNETLNALGNFRIKYPERFAERWSGNVDKLVSLINRKEIMATDEDIENHKRDKDKEVRRQAKKKAKKREEESKERSCKITGFEREDGTIYKHPCLLHWR